jgi:lambda repressor-like predicted transcriptional regulator
MVSFLGIDDIKTEHHDIAEILLKVVLNAIPLTPFTSTVEFIAYALDMNPIVIWCHS